jgi:hypothetical protein
VFFESTPERLDRSSWADYHTARTTFDLHVGFTRADVQAAFRRLAQTTHPDAGGTHEAFQKLVSQRNLLLRDATKLRLEGVHSEYRWRVASKCRTD